MKVRLSYERSRPDAEPAFTQFFVADPVTGEHIVMRPINPGSHQIYAISVNDPTSGTRDAKIYLVDFATNSEKFLERYLKAYSSEAVIHVYGKGRLVPVGFELHLELTNHGETIRLVHDTVTGEYTLSHNGLLRVFDESIITRLYNALIQYTDDAAVYTDTRPFYQM